MISIIIPTKDRAHLWDRGLLTKTLLNQTSKDFELLVCDDCSTDGTIDYFKALTRQDLPFPVKVFRTKESLEGIGASSLPDNVLFKEAGDIIIHLDDDGAINTELVEFVEALNLTKNKSVWYGETIFVDPIQLVPIHSDFRLLTIRELERCYDEAPFSAQSTPLAHEWGLAWGALYAAPTDEIRAVGGHDMALLDRRGQDSRLGNRLTRRIPAYFTTHMKFYHLGLSRTREAEKSGDEALKEQIRATKYVPKPQDEPATVNEEGFWDSLKYERVL